MNFKWNIVEYLQRIIEDSDESDSEVEKEEPKAEHIEKVSKSKYVQYFISCVRNLLIQRRLSKTHADLFSVIIIFV